MPEDAFHMADLLARSLEEGLGAEERALLDQWADSSDGRLELMDMAMDRRRFRRQFMKFIRIDAGRAWKKLLQEHPELQPAAGLERAGEVEGLERAAEVAGPARGDRETAGSARGDRQTAGSVRGDRETAGSMRGMSWKGGQTVSNIRNWLGLHWQPVVAVLGAGAFIYLGIYLVRIYKRLTLEGNVAYHHVRSTPAGHFAALLLADGSNYELASVSAGNLQELGCVTFNKTSDNSLSMALIPGCGDKHSETYPALRQPANNTLSTRNGGYYNASLLDGTNVRLNAASSLHFPTIFEKTKREVFLEGEGFFNVAPAAMNNNAPFVIHVFVHRGIDGGSGRADVLADTLTIVSLGTRFDIEAYPGEGGIRTRLQEGGLLLKTGEQQLSLRAGQTAILDDRGRLRLDNKTPADSANWEKGQFLFVEESADHILEELSRWYDVRFVYRIRKPQEPFTLKGFNRSAPLKDLLDELESMSDLHFRKSGDSVVYVLR